MDPRSEVLLRQAQLFEQQTAAGRSGRRPCSASCRQASGWSWHAGEQQRLQRRFAGRCSFGVDAPASRLEAAVLFLPDPAS